MLARTTTAAALAAVLAAALLGGPVQAQPAQPAELPPEGYTGQQFVDSTGCAFLRGSVNGQVVWLPRLDADRQPICGMEPSIAPGTPVVQVPDTAGMKEPPRQAAAPARTAPRTQPRAVQPVAVTPAGDTRHLPAVPGQPQAVQQPVPPGFRPAWTDDRLNPHRGERTDTGSAQMRLVWSNTVPQVLINAATGQPVTAREARALGITLPYGSAPEAYRDTSQRPAASANAPAAGQPASYVQVATFAVDANARNTSVALQARGLPVRLGHTTMRGQPVQVVMAGPYANRAAAQEALAQVRAMGFRDAFVR